jgi:hypothetical protein
MPRQGGSQELLEIAGTRVSFTVSPGTRFDRISRLFLNASDRPFASEELECGPTTTSPPRPDAKLCVATVSGSVAKMAVYDVLDRAEHRLPFAIEAVR